MSHIMFYVSLLDSDSSKYKPVVHVQYALLFLNYHTRILKKKWVTPEKVHYIECSCSGFSLIYQGSCCISVGVISSGARLVMPYIEID